MADSQNSPIDDVYKVDEFIDLVKEKYQKFNSLFEEQDSDINNICKIDYI
jgi:hypothetical protein